MKLRTIFAIAMLSLLTACSNITESSETGALEDASQSYDQVWTAEINPDSDGEEVGISCEDLSGLTSGDKGRCYVHFYVTNTSDLPQQYSGYYYLLADGVTYLSENSYQNSVAINPGDYIEREATFDIPYMASVTNMYLAESPTDAHKFDLSLDVQIRR